MAKKKERNLLLEWREAKDKSVRAAAEYWGYTSSWWSQMETGQKPVPKVLTIALECELKDK